jgi:hypothetical protein
MMRRRILFFIVVSIGCLISIQSNGQTQKFEKVLEQIEQKYNCNFTYSSSLIQEQKDLEIKLENRKLKDVLETLFHNTNINYSINGSNVILFLKKKKHTISGKIIEKKSGETLIGATIFNLQTKEGTSSNQFGFYSLSLSEGTYEVEVSFLGYKPIRKKINLKQNIQFDFQLDKAFEELQEISVTAKAVNKNVSEVAMSKTSVKIETIKQIPAFMGEVDVMKSLQMLPGIQSSGDATANLNVRGGSYDQNLILLDDAPIYNPSHALGFFSIFNDDAIKNVEIYKGGLPAQYGEKLSSVVDIRMKDGDLNNYHGSISIGSIASKFNLEGPIVKKKASFILSARYSYAGLAADKFANTAKELGVFSSDLNDYRDGNKINFYDINLKANYIINDKNRLFFSAYTGRDQFRFRLIDEKSSMNWGNIASTLRWNKVINQRLFANTTVAFSNFDYSYYILDDIRDFEWSSNLQEIALKSDFDFYYNANNHFKFGFAANYHRINPGEINPRSSTSVTKHSKLHSNYGTELASYLSRSHKVSDKLSLEYGIRFTSFLRYGEANVNEYSDKNFKHISGVKQYKKGELHKVYWGIDPRFNARYILTPKSSIKASYSRTRQYQHLLSTSSIGLPTDVWYLADTYIKPQIADIVAIGYFRNFKQNTYELSTEAYYKKMQNQIDFVDNANLFLNPSIEQEIKSGEGQSYGVEFMLRKTKGRFKGWLSYTWAKTELKIDGINQGKSYPTRYDKRNDLSATVSYDINKRMTLSSNFTYSTGGAITAPVGTYSFQGTSVNHYTARNSYRLPDYHRLDLSFIVKSKPNKKWKDEWTFSIYNVYNRHNAFSVYTKVQDYDVSSAKSYLIYMFGMVPSISYKVKF